jgi:integrase
MRIVAQGYPGPLERRSEFATAQFREASSLTAMGRSEPPVLHRSSSDRQGRSSPRSGCVDRQGHLSTRQYARLVEWVGTIGLDPTVYGTHSLRRTNATLIYQRTKNLRAVQLLLGHSKLESTVRYLGIEMEDALDIAEKTDV